MELFDNFKKKRQESKERELRKQARLRIGIEDFNNVLFISIDGTPLVPIEPEWTQKEILEHLEKLRNNYINSRRANPHPHGTIVL